MKTAYGDVGIVAYDPIEDKLQCHLCRKWFRGLGVHVVVAHGWSADDYRGEFGMLVIYAVKDQERIDEDIFAMHPFLPYWGTGEPRQVKKAQADRASKLQPLIDLIESGELDEGEIEQLLTLLKRKKD